MDEVLIGGIEKRQIVIVDYDPRWPGQFLQHAEILSRALGGKAIAIEHVGSTSVPGLAAKPIIDIDLLVDDSSDESTYLPVLLQAGYVLRVREPDFAKPSRNTDDPVSDLHWHFTTDDSGKVSIHCELAELSEYETFIQHVIEGTESQKDIAEMMGKPKGTVSKWAAKAVKEGCIRREGFLMKPPTAASKSYHDTNPDD